MNILDNKVSVFKSLVSTKVDKSMSIRNILDDFKTGTYKKQIDLLRGGDKTQKKFLPTFAMHGLFDGFRKKDLYVEANGIIILDIDDVEVDDIEEIKQEIIDENDNVLAAMTSPSGNGVKVLYWVNPDLVSEENYRQIGKQIILDFEQYGDHVDFLSVTDTLVATYDPDILINEDVVAAFIYINDIPIVKGEIEERDETKELWDDAEDFFDTVLAADIEAKTNNNYHFIQVAVLDLAKFGFRHPEEDLSFVVDYAESVFKYSSENKGRFEGVVELSKSYPQLKWPYKFGNDDDEEFDPRDEGYNDYSEYNKKDEKSKEEVDNYSDEVKKEIEEEEGDDFVDYEGLFESTMDVVKEGDRVGLEISLKNFADVFRFKGNGILTITGIPGHGKTEMVDAIALDLTRLYNLGVIIAGFEQSVEEHIIKLARKLIGLDITCKTWHTRPENIATFKQAYNFITSKIKHIDTNKTGGNINRILEASAKKIKEQRDNGENIRFVVLDPFNMLSVTGKYSGHEKIEEILRRITHFSHQMGVMILLVAHPFKMKKDEKTGDYEIPDFYSVKGSSAFFEMSYHGFTVYRSGETVLVRILKVKQNNMGAAHSDVQFQYDRPSGRYIPIDEEGNVIPGGNSLSQDWLEKALELMKK